MDSAPAVGGVAEGRHVADVSAVNADLDWTGLAWLEMAYGRLD